MRRSCAGKAGDGHFIKAKQIGGDRHGQQQQRGHHQRFLQLERPAHFLPRRAQPEHQRAERQAGEHRAQGVQALAWPFARAKAAGTGIAGGSHQVIHAVGADGLPEPKEIWQRFPPVQSRARY